MKCTARTIKIKVKGICIIRSPGEEDSKVIGDFVKICAKDPLTAVKRNINEIPPEKWTELLCKTGPSKTDITVMCAWGGKVIAAGCAFYDVKDNDITCRMHLFVRKAYRNFGVGKELLKELLIFAEDVLSSSITTTISAKDKRSIDFYLKNGFTAAEPDNKNNTVTLTRALTYSDFGNI